MTTTLVTEATTGVPPTPVEGKPGRLLMGLISPGMGSSGFYSQPVLEAAAKDKVFAKGTKMYIDHPTESEKWERPERSVKDLAAVLTEDARWDAQLGKLVAEVQTFPMYSAALAAMKDTIGASIRATADVKEGAKGREIVRLVEAQSVDFVTSAGRGGSILEVMESTRTTPVQEARNVGQWIESRIHRDFTITADDMAGDGRLTREERITLSGAIGDALAAFVTRLESDAPALYQRDLWDDPQDTVGTAIEASRSIPAGQESNIQESSGGHMATQQIEESELSELRAAAGRVTALESERDAAVTRAEAAEAARTEATVRTVAESHARARITAANADLAPAVVDRIVAESLRTPAPHTDGQLTESAFNTTVDAALTSEVGYLAGLQEAAGIGKVAAFGASTPVTVSEAELAKSNDNQRAVMFGRKTNGGA